MDMINSIYTNVQRSTITLTRLKIPDQSSAQISRKNA